MILAILNDGDLHTEMLLQQSGNLRVDCLSGLSHHKAPPELLATCFGPFPIGESG